MKRLRVVMFCVLAIVGVCAVVAVAQEAVEGEGLSGFATTVTTFLAGTLGVWLVQVVKKLLPENLGDKLMTWIAYGCAFVVAIAAFAIAGGFKEIFSDPWTAIQQIMTTGGFMTLAYATLKGKLGIKAKSEMKGR